MDPVNSPKGSANQMHANGNKIPMRRPSALSIPPSSQAKETYPRATRSDNERLITLATVSFCGGFRIKWPDVAGPALPVGYEADPADGATDSFPLAKSPPIFNPRLPRVAHAHPLAAGLRDGRSDRFEAVVSV